MQTQIAKWLELNQDNFAATQKWIDINNHLFMNLAQQQLELFGICVDSNNKQVQAWTQAKEPGEVITAQTELLNDFRKQVVNNIHVTVDVLLDNNKQVTQWTENSLKQVTQWHHAMFNS
ncbi:MAG: phasin family protein [Thioploca sp.]|nr:phasin family protein [Thioploca sp.]